MGAGDAWSAGAGRGAVVLPAFLMRQSRIRQKESAVWWTVCSTFLSWQVGDLNPEARDSRLIAVTGYGTKADKHLFEEAGFDYYFPKPTNIEELHRALSNR
jgi:CheY-like chemotaxis protein